MILNGFIHDFSLTKRSYFPFDIVKAALCRAPPLVPPSPGPLAPPDVRSRADAPRRLVPPQLDVPIGSPRIS